MGKGLPVVVRMGLRYVEVASLDEAEATYTATVDLRLRWQDCGCSTLRSPASGFLQFRDEAAAAKMAEAGAGRLFVEFLRQPSQRMHGLRIFPDGRVR